MSLSAEGVREELGTDGKNSGRKVKVYSAQLLVNSHHEIQSPSFTPLRCLFGNQDTAIYEKVGLALKSKQYLGLARGPLRSFIQVNRMLDQQHRNHTDGLSFSSCNSKQSNVPYSIPMKRKTEDVQGMRIIKGSRILASFQSRSAIR